jgi:hypothetical protein
MIIKAIEICFDRTTRQNEILIDGISQGYFSLPEVIVDSSPPITFRRPVETQG